MLAQAKPRRRPLHRWLMLLCRSLLSKLWAVGAPVMFGTRLRRRFSTAPRNPPEGNRQTMNSHQRPMILLGDTCYVGLRAHHVRFIKSTSIRADISGSPPHHFLLGWLLGNVDHERFHAAWFAAGAGRCGGSISGPKSGLITPLDSPGHATSARRGKVIFFEGQTPPRFSTAFANPDGRIFPARLTVFRNPLRTSPHA